MGVASCILPKLNETEWPKERKVTPVFVDSIFDAYRIFNTLALKKANKLENQEH
jgi:hypothetical protein